MSTAELQSEQKLIDKSFGLGVFDKMIARYRCESSAYLLWEKENQPSVLHSQTALSGKTTSVLKLVAKSIYRFPYAWSQHQKCYTLALLQLPELKFQSWGMEGLPMARTWRSSIKFQPNSYLPPVSKLITNNFLLISENPFLTWMTRHITYLMILIFGLIFTAWRKDSRLLTFSIIGIWHAISFSLIGPNIHWRYLFLTYLMGFFACLLITEKIIMFGKQQSNTSGSS